VNTARSPIAEMEDAVVGCRENGEVGDESEVVAAFERPRAKTFSFCVRPRWFGLAVLPRQHLT